jgi:hypothetical protein
MNERERTRLLLLEQTQRPMSYSHYRILNSAASVVTFLEIDDVRQEPVSRSYVKAIDDLCKIDSALRALTNGLVPLSIPNLQDEAIPRGLAPILEQAVEIILSRTPRSPAFQPKSPEPLRVSSFA